MKSRHRSSLLLAALAMCAFLLATPSFADTTYTYTGDTLFGTACNGCSIDGSFTVAAPLSTGPLGEIFQPESYSFSIDGLTFNNMNSNDGSGFDVVTNSLGDITNWIINLTNSNGDVFTADTFLGDTDIFTDTTGRVSEGDINVDNPGNWTASSTSTPEPSSILLLSGGLFGLGFMKRKVLQS